MHISRAAKNVFRYLPVLAVMAATALGLLLGNALHPTSSDFQLESPSQILVEPNAPQPWFVPGAEGTCLPGAIFTSYPPKCKTLDGKFIPLDDVFPSIGLPPIR